VERHAERESGFGPLENRCGFYELEDIAIPNMVNMYKFLKGSGFQIILTDKNGFLIEHFPPEEESIFYNWSEDILGTNAIGTAIKTKKSIQITGSEHYRDELHSLTSSAVPIFGEQGEVAAVLALIGTEIRVRPLPVVLSMLT